MNFVPRFNYPVGTEVTIYGQKMALGSVTDEGYELVRVDTGEVGVTSFSKFVELTKSGLLTVEDQSGLMPSAAELRLGGPTSAEHLKVFQQENGEFHHAICIGAVALRVKLRAELNDPTYRLTERALNELSNRKFIAAIASNVFGQAVNVGRVRGGKNSEWVLYRGRTIQKYLELYENLEDDDDVVACLATCDHLKGNETRRIPHQLLTLMTQAWEEIGFDLKGPSVANVHARLNDLVREANEARGRNSLQPLCVPSQTTLKTHREYLLTPTELLVATKGERHARNKRGRGSTDVRALFVGQLGGVDEVKMSLITSSKERGYWENLSRDDKKTLEEIDQEIRKRLTLLVMIDVASRMPLAWVVSDQPKAEATLALLRMATRDKTKEKIKYGCSGYPAPAMAIGNVKTDNGTGLRAEKVIKSLVGNGASYTAVRTYASSDKPYVERIIGTTESMVIKLLHGYTGRKAGELPGYDAKENGVLDIETLNEILSKFFIDEYPSLRHMGVGMGGRRPAEVIEELNRTRGLFKAVDEDRRRIHLGWKAEATPTDEGVRVFSGIWYNSDEFQKAVDVYPGGKVSVFVDPEDVTEATVLIRGVPTQFRLQLQVTAYAGLTVPEVLELTQAYRREHPDVTEIHEDRIASTRRHRFDLMRKIGVENKLSRSYSTVEECKAKARHVFGGARILPSVDGPNVVSPGNINARGGGAGVMAIGDGSPSLQHQPDDPEQIQTDAESVQDPLKARDGTAEDLKPKTKRADKLKPLGRPKTKGKFR